MSRVGKKPIQIPNKTKFTFSNGVVKVEGKKGKLKREIPSVVDLKIEEGVVKVILLEAGRRAVALQGLTRSLIANMIIGVEKGFERVLEINGVGYRATLSGNSISFNIGYSHPIIFELAKGVEASIDKNNVITLSGIDKELLGHSASGIRQLRPPEPYKGKGIKYIEERIQRKAGKTGAK
jgi:large subunit ribosomal protein L6